jgi:outer membrane protein assembly factor BamB
LAFLAVAGCAAPQAEWGQWGGPNRNFMVEAEGLADTWPEEGPPQLWQRELGDGYSTIVADDGVLYTMYRKGEDEFTVALSADTGETIWEHRIPSPFTPLMAEYGPGPHSTPLVVDRRLYTIGTNAVMHCFDKKTGEVLWKHDLPEAFGAPIPGRGYGASPIAYKDTVIVPVDRTREQTEGEGEAEEEAAEAAEEEAIEGQSLIAFDQATGEVVWKKQDYSITYPSPILIELDGQTQLVLLMEEGMMGVTPDDGELLWYHKFDPPGANLSTPVWAGDDLLFCSAAYNSGSRTIKLNREGGRTVPEQLWYSRKMRIHHANAIRVGDYVYGSSGDFGNTLITCMDIHTGDVAWRERGFKKSTIVHADGKFILLDEDGVLALASMTPEGMTLHSKAKVAEANWAWAAPTLVDKTLYVRDRKNIMALDLG